MIKKSPVLQFNSKASVFDQHRPFFTFPLAFFTSFCYYSMIALRNGTFYDKIYIYIILLCLAVFTTISHFYIYLTTLTSKLNFIVSQNGIIQKIKNEYYLIPWLKTNKISTWKTPQGWEISISTNNTNPEENDLDTYFTNKSYIIDQSNKSLFYKKNESAYLSKIHTFKENCNHTEIIKLDKFKPWKYLKYKIFYDTFTIYLYALLASVWMFYWL